MKGNEKKKQETLYITAGSEENLSGKETEQSICRILTEMEIPFQIMHHPPVYTSADCTEIEKTLQTSGCKNLFLRNSSGASWYLLLLPPEEKADLKTIAAQLGEKRLSFASAEEMKAILHTEPGAASILCLCYETTENLHILIHRKILETETIGCHPCVNTASLKITVRDLTEKLLEPAPVQHSGIPFFEYRKKSQQLI